MTLAIKSLFGGDDGKKRQNSKNVISVGMKYQCVFGE